MESGQAYLPGGEGKLVSGVLGLLGWEVSSSKTYIVGNSTKTESGVHVLGRKGKKRKRNVPFIFPDWNIFPGGTAARSFVLPIDLVHGLIAALIMLVTTAWIYPPLL